MSKIGKKPINVPEGVEVNLQGGVFNVKGKEGEIKVEVLSYVNAEIKDKTITLTIGKNHKQARANWGTLASLLNNAIEGVSKGFIKVLELEGVGFRATMEGANVLSLNIGYSNSVKFPVPAGVKASVEKNTIKIFGIDKALVGSIAAQIRKLKKPEPYKGKGIRYQGEIVRRKAGKKVAGSSAAA